MNINLPVDTFFSARSSILYNIGLLTLGSPDSKGSNNMRRLWILGILLLAGCQT